MQLYVLLVGCNLIATRLFDPVIEDLTPSLCSLNARIVWKLHKGPGQHLKSLVGKLPRKQTQQAWPVLPLKAEVLSEKAAAFIRHLKVRDMQDLTIRNFVDTAVEFIRKD